MKQEGLLLVMLSAVLFAGCGREQPERTPSPTDITRMESSPKAAPVDEPESYLDGEPSLVRNFYFVFDDSGSMEGQVGTAGTRIEIAKRATIEFLTKVPADVQMALYALNKGELVALGTDNRDDFVAQVGRLHANGDTPLNAAIRQAVDALVAQRRKQLGYGEFRVIVVTDGEARDGDIAKLAGPYARRARVPLYTIGFLVGKDHALRQFSVSYRAADNEQDLRRSLEEVAAESESFDATAFGK